MSKMIDDQAVKTSPPLRMTAMVCLSPGLVAAVICDAGTGAILSIAAMIARSGWRRYGRVYRKVGLYLSRV